LGVPIRKTGPIKSAQHALITTDGWKHPIVQACSIELGW